MIFAADARPSRSNSLPARPPVIFVFIAAAPRPLRLRRGHLFIINVALIFFLLYYEHALRDQQ